MTRDEAKRLVSELTGIPLDSLNVIYVAQCDGFLVAEPIRGGVSVLVGHDHGVLFGSSGIDFTQYYEDFRLGMRTDPSRFASMRERKMAWYAERANND